VPGRAASTTGRIEPAEHALQPRPTTPALRLIQASHGSHIEPSVLANVQVKAMVAERTTRPRILIHSSLGSPRLKQPRTEVQSHWRLVEITGINWDSVVQSPVSATQESSPG